MGGRRGLGRAVLRLRSLGKTSLVTQEARMSVAMPTGTARGVVYVHSTPAALCPHITWAIESVLQTNVHLDWRSQPIGRGLMRTDYAWTGDEGAGARLASALRGWHNLRYEITQDPTELTDGSRWSYTPSLGIHHTWTSVSGDAVVNEDRLRSAVRRAAGDAEALQETIGELLGQAWDAELEAFRYAGAPGSVRWLHNVG